MSSVRAQEDVAETKANHQIDTTPIAEPAITAGDREHWSFAPIKRQPLPPTKNINWSRTEIDAFILAKLEAKDIPPSQEADHPTLLRRLSFDLTGVPPTPSELADFEQDQVPDAYERQVDRLLASPAFGERYGQYWLDLARFAETDGFEHDYVRPQAWRFRDWVIAALNADLPYDEFVRQQLASDEENESSKFKVQGSKLLFPTLNLEFGTLNSTEAKPAQKGKSAPPPTPGQIPSMFCLSGPDMPDVNDQAERRHNLLNEMTSAVGAVFLGLQMGCAQCHNHKYDPISQADFYRLRAVFEPAVAALKRDAAFNVMLKQPEPATARLWVRGDHRRPGLEVPPAFPRIAATTHHSPLTTHESLRSALADWLVDASNPLTSRVIVNRIWQHHFGRGICTTPSDFGVMGGAVTHPELLDWLATELRDTGWSMKRLHRTILTSATYRQSSTKFKFRAPAKRVDSKFKVEQTNPTLNIELEPLNSAEPDPDNDLYSRFPRQRLSGEAIRDAMLAAAGLLSNERGGPGVMPPLPDELLSTLLENQWSASKREADHYRRSIYVFARRNLRYPIFEAFDRPDGNATCPIRNRSTTAPQSLLLFNSEFSLLAAQHLAGRILTSKEPKSQKAKDKIEQLYRIALSRVPTTDEAIALERFLADQQRRLSAEARPRNELALPAYCPDSVDPYAAAALVDACLAVLNTNEFIYVD